MMLINVLSKPYLISFMSFIIVPYWYLWTQTSQKLSKYKLFPRSFFFSAAILKFHIEYFLMVWMKFEFLR